MPSNEELLDLGKKAFAQKQKEQARTKAYNAAIRRLIDKHKAEFQGFFEEEKGE